MAGRSTVAATVAADSPCIVNRGSLNPEAEPTGGRMRTVCRYMGAGAALPSLVLTSVVVSWSSLECLPLALSLLKPMAIQLYFAN